MDLAQGSILTKSVAGPTAQVALGWTARVLNARQAAEPEFLNEWQALANRAVEPNPFFEPWFLLPSIRAFTNPSRQPRIFAVYREGILAGLMPLNDHTDYYGHRIPHRSGWLHTNAFYGAPLVENGSERAFWRTLLAHCDASPRFALFLHLPLMDAKGPVNRALELELGRTGRASSVVIRSKRAMLSSSLSPDAYLTAALSKKHRKELRRQFRRLSELGDVTIERLENEAGLDQWIGEFLMLEAAGWKGEAGSALQTQGQTGGFFAATIRGAARQQKLKRLTMRLDGKPIAMLASFITLPGSYSFKTAYDESYSAHSPGLQLQIENLATLSRPDIEWTDSCAAEGHPMIERLWTERRTLVSRNIAIGGALRRSVFGSLSAFESRKGVYR